MHQFVARRSLVADRGGLGVVPGGDDLGLVELCNARLDVVEVRLVRLEASVDGGQRVLDLRASQEAADHNRFEHRQDSDESDERKPERARTVTVTQPRDRVVCRSRRRRPRPITAQKAPAKIEGFALGPTSATILPAMSLDRNL